MSRGWRRKLDFKKGEIGEGDCRTAFRAAEDGSRELGDRLQRCAL